jgi:hypothetical protein
MKNRNDQYKTNDQKGRPKYIISGNNLVKLIVVLVLSTKKFKGPQKH